MRSISSYELARLLAALPQELYDEIYNLTFTAAPGVRVVTKGWKPPHLLGVDSISRQRYATSYFASDATFLFRLDTPGTYTIAKWLSAWEEAHIARLDDVRYEGSARNQAWTPVGASAQEALRYYIRTDVLFGRLNPGVPPLVHDIYPAWNLANNTRLVDSKEADELERCGV